ncbi:hypothetical protein C0J52_09748 [Blattella germanica]|nr:hypothetical protein C0J52_09748 [Blattella germanica]
MGKQEWQDNSPLCCCEYWNIQHERSHILGCCCNCEDFDESVERLIGFERVPFQQVSSIMSTFQDRLRIPWRGGAKQISIDSALPIFLQPLFAYIAAQSVWCTAVVSVFVLLSILYLYSIFVRFLPRTKFFFVWTLTSAVLLLLVFEISVVPFLEIMPHENCILIGLVISSGVCLYKVRTKAELNHVVHADMVEETELVCAVCRRRVPPRTFHCRICQACIIKRDHHCVWIAVCFVSSIYCIVMAFLLLLLLLHQCWLISLGMTGQEWRCVPGSGIKWCASLRSERAYSLGLFSNWREFLSCRQCLKEGRGKEGSLISSA